MGLFKLLNDTVLNVIMFMYIFIIISLLSLVSYSKTVGRYKSYNQYLSLP